MDNQDNKSKYLRWLEILESKLKDMKALSANGAKLAVLQVLYELQRANELFLQVKESASGGEYSHDLLKIDEDVNYADWSSTRLNIRPEIQRLYFDGEIAHASELQNIKNSLWGIIDALDTSKLEELGVDKTDYQARLQNLLWGKVDDDLLLQALSKLLSQLRLTLAEIDDAMKKRKLNLADGEKLYNGLEMRFNLWRDNPIEQIWQNWLANFEDKDDWEVIKRHAVGKWYEEILLFFKSGFLAPKLENQQKADMANFNHEITFDHFQNVPEGLDLQRNYSALRDLFHYNDECFKPKKGAIGKYIFNHRKEVREEQRNALFRFIQIVMRLDEVKQTKAGKCPKAAAKTAPPPSALPITASSLCKFIPNPQDAEKILKLLHELMDGQTKPLDIMMPIRAAMEAGAIRRPTWDEFRAEFGEHKLKAKSSFTLYTGNGYQFDSEVFNVIVAKFKSIIVKM